MSTVREIIKRDIGVKVEGVVKVFDRATLGAEMREYVVTDKIEEELRRIFDTFAYVSETLRRGAPSRDVMGIWVSGFFGSGKSHFAKVLGHLLQNTPLDESGSERSQDVFVKHLSDSPRARDIKLRLGELKANAEIRTVFFEINSRKTLNNPNSVGEILLSEFYRSIGLAENFVVARIERSLEQRGLLERLVAEYEAACGVPWRSAEGRDDLMTVRQRLAKVLPQVDAAEYPDESVARQALKDTFQHERITAEGIADELVAWVDAQKTTGGKAAHLVFVIDEMGTFIGDSQDRISELNSLAEMIGNKGKGKVWLIVTSQQDLERVVDRTNFQPTLVGRLNARFELKPQLISDEVNKVVAQRILKKHPSQEAQLKSAYDDHEGFIAQLADVHASRTLGEVTQESFVDSYPFLPHQIRLAQDIFEKLSGFRISGGVRSMISVVMDALQEVADEDVGVVVSFDQVFDAVENDLLSQEYLGASGVRSIQESDDRVAVNEASRRHPTPASVLKVLWLLQKITWVPRVPETIAKLLVNDLHTDLAALRSDVETTLDSLRDAGYVARDEATGEWKFLNERERTIEQAIQEMLRPGGATSISLAAARRLSQQICKEDLITKRKLTNFAVSYGSSKTPFGYSVWLDGEAIDTGPELEVRFTSPLAPSRVSETAEIRQQNQSAGAKGRCVWLVATTSDLVESRLKRYEALLKITADKRLIDDASADTQVALSDKRRERDELRTTLARDLERAFLAGTLFYAGQEVELDGSSDLKEPVERALRALIPNLYPRFAVADKPIDFARHVKAILNPSKAELHEVAPELGLFDTQGNLHRESALVAPVLEVLADLEDEGRDSTGASLLASGESKGFRGFSLAPYAWPDEMVRLVLTACMRAGAVFFERQSAAGPTPVYDYRGTDESFLKITLFKKLAFRLAQASLSPEQMKQASRALALLGMGGVAESSNAVAAAVRDVEIRLRTGLDEARGLAARSLPIPHHLLTGDQALVEAATAKDPVAAVAAFLSVCGQWQAMRDDLDRLRGFQQAGKWREYELSRWFAELAANHPLVGDAEGAAELEQALNDMAALIDTCQVVERWSDYRDACDVVFATYRDAYAAAYGHARGGAEATMASLQASDAYARAPEDQRDAVVARTFGPGGACHYPALDVSNLAALLEASSRRSLTSLREALVALPGYRVQVEADLRALTASPQTAEAPVHHWHASHLLGRQFSSEADVDDVLKAAADDMKAKIRDGFTVIVD